MKENNKNIVNNIEEVFNNFSIKKQIAVAVSGGCDSLALTIALNDYCLSNKIKIVALTVNHNLRKNSLTEANQLNKLLSKYNIQHLIFTIDKSKVPLKNIESNLREIRYQILSDYCKNNNIEYLFVGHHLGDIAENFMIRLLRGSGLDGLAPIAQCSLLNNIKLIRPFLNLSKNDLKNYLLQQNIEWFEDETNDDEKFLRNKIRKFLASFAANDFNGDIIAKRIASASHEIANARDLFDEIMLEHEKAIIIYQDSKNVILQRDKLVKINKSMALKILAKILMNIGAKKYKPRKEKLIRFYEYLSANGVLKKREFYGCVCYQNELNQAKITAKID